MSTRESLESKLSSLSTDFCKSEINCLCSWAECDFRSDSPAELALLQEEALSAGADAAVVSNHWAEGGAGARALAEAVIEICEGTSQFKFLYDLELSIEEKINIIGKQIYGADGIELSDLARQQVETYTRQGYNNLPSKSSTAFSLVQ